MNGRGFIVGAAAAGSIGSGPTTGAARGVQALKSASAASAAKWAVRNRHGTAVRAKI
jgi:hypothetical protein